MYPCIKCTAFSPFIDPILEFGWYKSWQNDNQEFNQYNTKVVQGSWAKWQKEGGGEGEGVGMGVEEMNII